MWLCSYKVGVQIFGFLRKHDYIMKSLCTVVLVWLLITFKFQARHFCQSCCTCLTPKLWNDAERLEPPNKRTYKKSKNFGKTSSFSWVSKYVYVFAEVIEERGLKPILDMLQRLGGWPVLDGDKWDEDGKFNWKDSVYRFRDAGYSVDYFLDFSIGVDLKNSTIRTIDVS